MMRIENNTLEKRTNRAVSFLGVVSIIGLTVSLILMVDMAINSNITGEAVGIKEEENIYGTILILGILLIASIVALAHFARFTRGTLDKN